MGATAGLGAGCLNGGLGSVSAISDDGVQVGALVAVNPFGSVIMPGTDAFWAWPWEVDGEFGGLRPGPDVETGDLDYRPDVTPPGPANTTLGVVATNVRLDKAQAQRIAIMAHDGIARAIRPVHTPLDGDTIFVISTACLEPADPLPYTLARLGMLAADCVARAIARGVYAAESVGDYPGYKERHAGTSSGS
jgi:L-aminopeptidase/D-esterase-like protein